MHLKMNAHGFEGLKALNTRISLAFGINGPKLPLMFEWTH
jgi:hypothetical protein